MRAARPSEVVPRSRAPNGTPRKDSGKSVTPAAARRALSFSTCWSPDPKFDQKSWAVFEARGDYARRYVRQLEIRGPGALTVKPDKWRVQPGTVRGLKAALVEFDPDVHAFTRAENYQAASRRARSEAAS